MGTFLISIPKLIRINKMIDSNHCFVFYSIIVLGVLNERAAGSDI